MKTICENLYGERNSYYHRWYHPTPMMITSERASELERMWQLLYRCIVFLGKEYREFVPRYMPLNEKEMAILDYQSRYNYKAGALRPDYLVREDGQLLLVENTCRFFGHGIWTSYPAQAFTEYFMQDFPNEVWDNDGYYQQLEAFRQTVPDGKKIVVLKSSDRTVEIPLYKAFYEHFGHEVIVLESDEVEKNRELWSHDAVIFCALNQTDLMSYSMDTLRALVDAGMKNDFRTILLAHDKRMFGLIFEDDFTCRCLTDKETEFLREHTIRPFIYNNSTREIWEDAKRHKDEYILKDYRLGKSVGVYAGVMTSEEEWQSLFTEENLNSMLLQHFVHQRTYHHVWEGTPFDDYVCGELHNLDEKYLGHGFYRASSAPVTNKTDNRRMAFLVSDSERLKRVCNVL